MSGIEILRTVEEVRAWRAREAGTVGFVPTMGDLHEGHLALAIEAGRLADRVIVSVFVNPTQFGPGEDFERYPRNLEVDAKKAQDAGAHAVFSPDVEVMYPPGDATRVRVDRLTANLCGVNRPGHFEGVTTVVTRLFNIVRPDVAVFGQKDYQQLTVIRRMVADLHMQVDVVGYPTVREEDGLAKSSRNRYLTPEDRARATLLSSALVDTWVAWRDGERDGEELVRIASARFEGVEGTQIDYVEAVHPDTLEDYEGERARVPEEEGVVVAMAVHVGLARLLDNARLDAPLPPELELKRRQMEGEG